MTERATQRLAVLRGQFADSSLDMQDTAASPSAWANVPQAPPDAILGISEAFKKDSDSRKLNLGVGAYRTAEGKPLVLNVVRTAEKRIAGDTSRDKEYAAIGGNARFCELSARLAFGESSGVLRDKRNCTVQALSGTGSLRVGAEFLARHYPGPKLIYLPDPTWANHNKIFPAAGIEIRKYRYYLPKTRGLDYEGLIADLSQAQEGSVVLLHACAHNPTGVDPTPDQWQGILRVVQKRRLLPFFDSAYQGFASGDLDRDAAAVRLFADAGLELLLAQSYAKNMGLYGERVGALTVVSKDPGSVKRVESQLKQVIRAMYSSPPRHGAEIAELVLSDPQLFREWKVELKGMADRIISMRKKLLGSLEAAGAPGGWEHVVNQIGMFSFTGLTSKQVEVLTNKYHIYLTKDGRISMAGLNEAGCEYLAKAITDAVQNA